MLRKITKSQCSEQCEVVLVGEKKKKTSVADVFLTLVTRFELAQTLNCLSRSVLLQRNVSALLKKKTRAPTGAHLPQRACNS